MKVCTLELSKASEYIKFETKGTPGVLNESTHSSELRSFTTF